MSFICADCVQEPYLQRLVQDAARPENPCEYCDCAGPAADILHVAKQCEAVLDTYYEESSHTMAVVHFNRCPAGNDLRTTILQLTRMPENAVDDVVEYLGTSGTTPILASRATGMMTRGSFLRHRWPSH